MSSVTGFRAPSGDPLESLRLIQVGFGGFGRSWAREVFPHAPDVELVACVDNDPTALQEAQRLTSLAGDRFFLSLSTALDSVAADAVLISASLAAHVPSAMTALAAGKHVLMEKPFAPTLREAQEVVRAAEEHDRVLMISQNYRFFPAVRAVTALLASGECGQVDAVHVDFRRLDNSASRTSHRHYFSPEPMLIDMAVHHFDLMRLVLGREPVEVYCSSWNPSWSNFEDPPEAMALIRFQDDISVSYWGSWVSNGPVTPWAGEWRMELSGAEVVWTSRDGKPLHSADAVSVRPKGKGQYRLSLPDLRYTGRTGSLRAFVEAVRHGHEPETSGRQNLKTLALTLAAVESARTGKPIEIGKPMGAEG